jgi:hypothetical protein
LAPPATIRTIKIEKVAHALNRAIGYQSMGRGKTL